MRTRCLSQIDKVAQARAELEKANARMLLELRGQLNHEQWLKLQSERPPMHHGGRRPGPGAGLALVRTVNRSRGHRISADIPRRQGGVSRDRGNVKPGAWRETHVPAATDTHSSKEGVGLFFVVVFFVISS